MKDAYDYAVRICHILMLHRKVISREDDVIIYPSDWIGSSSFEISIRGKKYFDGAIYVNIDKIFEIIEKYGATPTEETYIVDGNEAVTPIKIRFNNFEK